MTSRPFDPDVYVDESAVLLGIDLTEESRRETVFNLRVAVAQAQLLFSDKIEESEEPAPVYKA